MARGRKPLPKAVLKLRGSSALRQPRHRRSEPDPPEGKLRCPSWLDREGKREFRRLIVSLRGMGILRQCDRGMICAMAQQWSLFCRASRELNGYGPLDRGARPLVATANDAFAGYMRGCGEFALSPAARTRVDVDLEIQKLDAFDQFISSRRSAVRKKDA